MAFPWAAGEELDADDVNAIPPIGTVLPWLKTFTGTPALPAAWAECNGQVLSDADSPYDGETLPDLNGDNRFLRGNSTSGGTGGEETHTLTVDEIPAHTHTVPERGKVGGGDASTQPRAAADANDAAPVGASGSTGGGAAHENRPPFYDVVWIMKIK